MIENTCMDPVKQLLNMYEEAHIDLHQRWSRAVGTLGYDKSIFQSQDNALSQRYITMLSALGYRGPLIRW